MNDDLEQRLRSLRLASPSAELDQRMHELFAGAAKARATRPGGWLVLMAPLAGVAAALAIFSMQVPPPAPVPEPLVCHIEPTGMMRDMLVPATRGALPFLEAAVQMGETSP